MPQPRFTRRPSASRMIRLPSGKMTWSTCGLMFSHVYCLERRDLDLVVEVADVAHDRLVLHALHVLVRDDVDVAGGGDEDVGLVAGVVHRHDAIAFHRRLQRADRVDLGDPHLRRQRAQRLRRALADVAVARDERDLARDHHVGRALDAVDQRLAAAVEVVELRLRDRVVDVDRREAELAFLVHRVQALHARGRLFGHALDAGLDASNRTWDPWRASP